MNKSKQDVMQAALAHHQAGRLEQAQALYKKMGNHPDALNLQGVIAYQTGQHDKAIEWIKKALRVSPANAVFHYNLALAYRAQNKVNEAIASYSKAVKLKPDYPDAQNNL